MNPNASLVPLGGTAAKPPVRFVDPDRCPPRYKMISAGTCLHPLITDGAVLAFDRKAVAAPLDIVAIFLTEGGMGTFWEDQIILKRLVQPFLPRIRLGAQAARAGGNAASLMIVEQLNPFRQYTFRPDQVLGVHACIGVSHIGPRDWTVAAPELEMSEGRHHG